MTEQIHGSTMNAVVFMGEGSWAVESIQRPTAGNGDVLLRVLQTGVCGTDEHLLHGGFIAKFPLVPGHEILAVVEAHGEGVSSPAIGTRVVLDNTIFCGECTACARGNDLFCENFTSLGCNAPGGFAEYLVAKASKVIEVTDLSDDVAVFTEPTACAVHGVDVLALKPASDVLILGAGPTGLILSQLLRMAGAARVTVAAPTASKLALAKRYGADHVVQLSRANPDQGMDELESIAPEGFDAVIEATGSTALLERAVSLTRTGGTILVYGLAGEEATSSIRPYEIFSRELTIKGSFAQAHCFDRAVIALRSGRIQTEGMITSRIPLDGFEAALDNLHNSEHIKTIVTLGRPE
ncbi:zinc-dependent alcohol dehydrogenase family protein [Lysinibacter cavernae]|uniref:D-arabinitol dehydrogenase (NADP+) n=1 Tax=Lysinibacter cavernae TaxID=1640652 RepID=A0A7X5TSZ3_9MICO|nr:zinc-dependent alcohol dehydrogenase family protein [Lysinibacter cavernae]NIH53590.1 D-arabinitol dehydrogenase (NADP+) [Lysinibacter cavernae]